MANHSATTPAIAGHITVIDGQATTTTQDIADVYGKSHDNVLKVVRRRMAEAGEWGVVNFNDTPYTNPQNGQTYPVIRMTKKGFHFVVGKFTGARAVAHQIAFADEFERMEAALTQPQALPATITPAQCQHLRELVQLVVESGKQSHGETWNRLHRKMKVNSYKELVPAQFDAACAYLQSKMDDTSMAALVTKHFPNALQLAAPSIKNRRWLVSFDHNGREVVQAVPNDEMVVSPGEIPGLLLDPSNGIFTAKEVLEIAGHANLRMMTEVCKLDADNPAKKLRDQIKTCGTTDLSEFAKAAFLELSLRGEFQGAAA